MTSLTAFVSSHSSLKDFEGVDYQRAAIEVAARLKVRATCMDGHVAGTDLGKQCRQSVRDNDILILIVGWRYGQHYEGGASLTEIEWQTADAGDKEIVVLMHDIDPPPDIPEADLERAIAFREQFNRPGPRPLYATFTNLATFELALLAALSAIVSEQSFRVLGRSSDEVADVIRKSLEGWRARDGHRIERRGSIRKRRRNPLNDVLPDYMREVAGIPEYEDEVVVTEISQARQCLTEHERLIVVGEFGCGKTNFLESLRLIAAEGILRNPKTSRVPLLVNLGGWNPTISTFRSFIESRAVETYGDRLAGNDLLLLLDEIDNRDQPLTDAAMSEVVTWLAARPRAWAAVAIRQIDGLGERLHQATPSIGFAQFEFEPIDSRERADFVRRNTLPGPPQDALLAFIATSEQLGNDYVLRMLGSPFDLMLLTAFAWAERSIPANAALLLRTRVAAAFKREALTGPAFVSTERFIQYLGDWAIRSLGGHANPGHDSTGDEIASYERLASALGVFSKSGRLQGKTWTGRFLAYFAGEALVLDGDLLFNIHPSAVYGDRRRVAGRLDAALHDLIQLDPARFDDLAACDPCLAADCVQHVPREQRAAAIEHVCSLLLTLVSSNDASARSSAIEAIAAIGPDAVPPLTAALSSNEYWYRRRVLSVLSRIDGGEATEVIVRALGDDHKRVVESAERAVLAFESDRRLHVEAFIRRFAEVDASETEVEILVRLSALDPTFAGQVRAVLGDAALSDLQLQPVSATVGIPVDVVDEDDRSSGQPLLEQLRRTPSDPSILERCRKWLAYGTFHDRIWAHLWTGLWDRSGDTELHQLGCDWLRAVPETAGSWSNVWVRLAEWTPNDKGLVERGREWLNRIDPQIAGWAHVWGGLFKISEGARDVKTLGVNWLQYAEPAPPGWSIVWLALREEESIAGQQRFNAMALRLLRTTPFADLSWGLVFPTLLDRQRSDDLFELGQTYIASALPTHPGWSHVFSALMKKRGADPVLRAIGRDWLSNTGKSDVGWTPVWEGLWSSDKRNHDLMNLGLEFLSQADANYHGWARVFKSLWDVRFERDRLAELAAIWLAPEGAPLEHRGWSWVFTVVFNSTSPSRIIQLRAIEYLSVSSRQGWASVWSIAWRGMPHPSGTVEANFVEQLETLGREWLRTFGVRNDGFSHVWEPLWQKAPDAELRALALERLARYPGSTTVRYVWEALSVSDTDPSVTRMGMWLLQSPVLWLHPHWSAIWQNMWLRTNASPSIAWLGQDWLISHAGQAGGWTAVWKILWQAKINEPSLSAIGVVGLSRSTKAHWRSGGVDWRVVWQELWKSGYRHPRFRATTLSRLGHEPAPLADFWIDIAEKLASEQPLPADLTARMARRSSDASPCEQALATSVDVPGWWREMEEAWKYPDCKPQLVEPALQWMAINEGHRAFPHIWRKLVAYGEQRERVLTQGEDWVRSGSSKRAGWGFVWHGLTEHGRSDPAMNDEARKWLDERSFPRSTWPLVWCGLWDAKLADPEVMLELAQKWLDGSDNPAHPEYAKVWCRVWDASSDRRRVRRNGFRFLALPDTQVGWVDVSHRMAAENGERDAALSGA